MADASVVDSSGAATLLRFPVAGSRFGSLCPRCTSPSQTETLGSGALSMDSSQILSMLSSLLGETPKQFAANKDHIRNFYELVKRKKTHSLAH